MKYYAKLMFGLGLLIMFGLVSGCTDSSEDKVNSTTDSVDSETSANNQGAQPESDANSQTGSELAVQVSLDELKKHGSKEDCWIAYKGDVFDITSFLPLHPGSAGAITPYCGTSLQFENAFTGQHGTGKVKVLLEKGIFKGELVN